LNLGINSILTVKTRSVEAVTMECPNQDELNGCKAENYFQIVKSLQGKLEILISAPVIPDSSHWTLILN